MSEDRKSVIEAARAKFVALLENTVFADRLQYLACRWQDEVELKKLAPQGDADMEYVKASKRPFGIVINYRPLGWHVLVSANSTGFGWKVVKVTQGVSFEAGR